MLLTKKLSRIYIKIFPDVERITTLNIFYNRQSNRVLILSLNIIWLLRYYDPANGKVYRHYNTGHLDSTQNPKSTIT